MAAASRTVFRRTGDLFIFLRHQCHALCSVPFQHELATLYQEAPQGQPPVPPAQLAVALILQASTGVSDDEVIEATPMDRRWHLVLDCLDTETPPFSNGTFGALRARLPSSSIDAFTKRCSWPRAKCAELRLQDRRSQTCQSVR